MSLSTSFLLIVLFIIIHIVIFEIYSVLFRITGLTKEKAKFQSISLLTNSGYTTSEAEIITTDRTRRRIALFAMITGYAFSVVIISLLINVFLTFNMEQIKNSYLIIIICCLILVLIIVLICIPKVKNAFDKIIEKIAADVFKRSNKENVITLLDNYGKDAIAEVYLNFIPDELYNKSLMESNIKNNYNMNILMYNRKGKTHDVTKDTIFQKGDILIIFGNLQNIKNVFIVNTKNKVKELENAPIDNDQNDIDLIENYGSEAMATITINNVPDLFEDKKLFETQIKENYKINILMIKRNELPVALTKDTVILKGDKVTVLGPYVSIKDAFLIKK